MQRSQITKFRHKAGEILERRPFECIALLLQGGGALGAYQAGVYEALDEVHLHPDWVAGISIGAINAALIAGNPVESRVEMLRQFWESVTSSPIWSVPMAANDPLVARGDLARTLANQVNAGLALVHGAPGFFQPRWVLPWLQPSGTPEAISYYDTATLKSTLERFVDFDRINAGEMHFSGRSCECPDR
jgi:NTE family protein